MCSGVSGRNKKPYSVDLGYERFLAPEIFFNPEIYTSDWATPLPEVIDEAIKSSPIDTRRALYVRLPFSTPQPRVASHRFSRIHRF